MTATKTHNRDRPLLSVVIPSCNRHKYLLPVLRTLLTETEVELVVSDNSDLALSPGDLSTLGAGARLIYQHHTERLSVVDNFERGLQLATGEYLIFIGDDDCVGPGIENIVRWARTEGIDAVVSYRNRFIASYFWPGVKSKYFGDGYAGKMFVARHSGRARQLDTHAAIRGAAEHPGSGLCSMARAYHGIVSRKLVDRVVAKYGRLFGGVSPDIYSATLLTYEAHKAYVLDYPFIIPGASPPSTAGEGAARKDTDGLKDREHIRRFGDSLVWDARIPAFYSPITVWAYSQQAALQLVNDPSLSLNFPALYLRCLVHYWKYRQNVTAAASHWRLDGGNALKMTVGLRALVVECTSLVTRIWFKFVSPPEAFAGLQTIGDAYELLKSRAGAWIAPHPSR